MDEDFIWMIFCLVTAFVVSGYLQRRFDVRRQKKEGR
ncbi:Uncharacterised protein [uncultured Anaerotruncus sp.]|jgi:hypothetical protein|uniref:Uncharacterized protein n=1 Tax=uncultured Anaerotruncus sp. TaxID=905011 RepID=A0A6N2URR5_9FIRM